ncbi:phosphatidylserine decarboxylase proenzyme [Clostridium acetireducens DSM 10703]|jgi:phosphatidylserine decarboxylase|uniref:Phosphatidylserine decarboxylase proenzyme n=1 Tax=Clostridium acetireducens DSM 10703 TaxID=1121290 RepID=A0A1E8EWG8_9CLOT|nr:phosphatidylserine decarboxylase [Clostridium acetireducens]OFI04987.1 phosphatidylserine decarboxylase proenzyme [Clostridium acetireducens DSM 10703]
MIKVYNRKNKCYEIEDVAGEKYLNWLYSSTVGMSLLELLIKRKLFSKIYGMFCESKISKKKIYNFVKDFNIDTKNCKKSIEEFENFNDFFVRELTPEIRPIDKNKNHFISPGDGRITVYTNINLQNLVQIKGFNYSFSELINNKDLEKQYNKGTCILLRLCPTDYHRFHFIDSGICSSTNKVKGNYYSVNPIALKKINKLFCQNKREWSVFHSSNFSDILYVEVGATCVGSIIQTYKPNNKVEKGEEKGFFKFGGSTIILFLKNNVLKIDKDILKQSSLGFETKVLMGEKIGEKY